MKTRTLLMVVLLSVTAAARSEENPELTRLRESYKAAVDRATKPLTQSYVNELTKLRDKFTRAANLEAANSVQAEIDSLAPATAAQPSAPASAQAGKAPDPRWFVGKSLVTERGSKWVFDKEGNTGKKMKGSAQTATFTWKISPAGLIEVTESADGGVTTGLNYIRFDNRHEAWAGSEVGKLEVKLRVE